MTMMAEQAYPVSFDIDYPERLSRWKPFVKALLAIPHYVVLGLYGIAYYVVVGIAWLAILFTGRYPRGLFNFSVNFWRYATRLNCYLLLLRDDYPPFGGAPSAEMPVTFDVQYPDRLSRWKIFVKGILALPHLIILGAYGGLVYVTTAIAFLAILFTGRYPRGLFNLAVGYLRWGARVQAYVFLMTDEYPPFSGS